MIYFCNVTHFAKPKKPLILDDVSLEIPIDRRIALLGLRGSGRSSVLRLINGFATPRIGYVLRPPGMSFFPGTAVGIAPKMTIEQWLVDVARMYRVNYYDLVGCVVEWGDAEALLPRQFGKLNPQEKQRITIPLCYALPFSFYLIDGLPFAGPPAISDRLAEVFKSRIDQTGCIYAAKQPKSAAKYCDAGLILHEGQLVFFDNLAEAIALYEEEIEPHEKPEDPEDAAERVSFDNRMRELEETPPTGVFF